jgi:4-amino-4-deoxy-L-arabinose transferase-like glycosyltransferase
VVKRPVFSASLARFRFHWPILVVAVLAFVFIFTNLGSDYLWEDEGDTAAFAVNILKFGVPRAWDGVTFIDSDGGAPLNQELVLISHPWLQYYLTAASFAVFGQTNWAARLPFAVAGWLTILVTYLCAYDLTKNRWAALCSASLLTASVQFLLFCRQCRYYPLSMLLACLLVWIFFNMRSIRSALLFAIVGILLFHSHPFGIVLIGALGLIGFAYPIVPDQRRFLCWAGLVIALFVFPWIAFVRSGYAGDSVPVSSTAQFAGRLIQYAIECTSVTPLIGIVILSSIFALSWMLRAKNADALQGRQDPMLDRRQLGFLFVTFVTLLCYAGAMAIAESSDDIWRVGIRYTTAIMPLTAITAGMLIVNVSHGRSAIWLPLLLIFVFTKLTQLTPWIFWGQKQTTFDGKELVRAHLPLNYAGRYLTTPELLAFLRDLKQENPGTLAKVCQFLQGHANAGDLVLTNYDWEPLYFYTRLPQSLRIFPGDPIYQTARRKRLPEYVFNVDGARWVIWRPVWDGYFGYVGSEIRRNLLNSGARITKVAVFPETIFENRPEVHFHRFSGDKYFFIALDPHVTAQIVRVDWPGVMLIPPGDQKN